MPQERSLIVKLRALYYAATIARFNLIILLAGSALLFVGQGQDLLVTIAEDGDWFSLLGGGLLWALSIWYWARVLLDVRFPDPPVSWAELAWWRKHLPRLLGFIAFLALAASIYRATGNVAHALFVIATGAAYYLFVIYRRKMQRWLARWRSGDQEETSYFWIEHFGDERDRDDTVHPRWQDDVKRIWGRLFVKITMLLGIAMFIWGMACPLNMGFFFNTLVLLFAWGATFLPLGSAITYIGSRKGLPLFGILILMAIFFSRYNDNHQIRELAQNKQQTRPDIEAALDQWMAQHCKKDECDPMVIVATAGGGIRAAYWTGTVLGALDDELSNQHKPPLRDNLFAISSVSGGSVGATVYRATLEAGVERGSVRKNVQNVLSQDYLAPLSAGMLYPDLLQRFLPRPWLKDRATVFEQSLEAGFKEVLGKNTMESSFTGLTAGKEKDSWPALFLNATWSNNGRRIVAAGYQICEKQRLYADMIDTVGYDMRLSTAAHNSARFPYVSPPGSWMPTGADDAKQTGNMRQRLQDGGLFENFGAETALEIVQVARSHFRKKGMKDFDPVLILISSDPTLSTDFEKPVAEPQPQFGYEVLTTIRTFEAARNGHANEAAAQFQNWNKNKNNFAYFRMCDNSHGDNPPLGWSLSKGAQKEINGYLFEVENQPVAECRPGNRAALDKVIAALDKKIAK